MNNTNGKTTLILYVRNSTALNRHPEFSKRGHGNLNAQESPRFARKRVPEFDQQKDSTNV